MSPNDYHLEFLKHLESHCVNYLVIGGQAHKFLDKTHDTNDLDIWLSLERQSRKNASVALLAWARKYPHHTNDDFNTQLTSGIQIHFPKWDYPELKARDGIDLLTSLGDLDFNQCMGRAKTTLLDTLIIKSLCAEDLSRSPQKTK